MQPRPDARASASIPEVASLFGIARSTAYALAKRDALPVPVIRLGRRLVVSRALLERVLAGEAVKRGNGGDHVAPASTEWGC